MTYCHVSRQIAAHCDEPAEVECPCCNSIMLSGDTARTQDDLFCTDADCDHVIYSEDDM